MAAAWTMYLVRLVLLGSVFLSGCGPRFEMVATYTPPVAQTGKTCVQEAALEKSACESRSHQQGLNCQVQAQEVAKIPYQQALVRYNEALVQYERCQQQAQAAQQAPRPAASKVEQAVQALSSLCLQPREPQLADFVNAKHCKQDTACQSAYDIKFEGCGGKIVRENRCVANCEKQAERPPSGQGAPQATTVSQPSASTTATAALQRAKTAYDRQDYATALREWQPLAQQGNATAQLWLGAMYEKGQGVPKDDAEAVRLYQQAVAQGSAGGQYQLGTMYERGHGIAKDNTEAVRLYQQAAARGIGAAQYRLGHMYEHGQGVARNLGEAQRWYAQAAETAPSESNRAKALESRDRVARQLAGDQPSTIQSAANSPSAGTPILPARASAGLPSAASATEMWTLIENSSDPEDFRSFLQVYADSPFASQARQRLAQLERTAGRGVVQTAAAPPAPGGPVSPPSAPLPLAAGAATERSIVPAVGGGSAGATLRTVGDSDRQASRLAAGGYTVILKVFCEDIKTGGVMAQVNLTGMSTESCEDARRFLQAQDEKQADCTWPETREGKKEWVGTENCRVP